MIGWEAYYKSVSPDDFDSQFLVSYWQTYDCGVQVIMDKFMNQRGGIVME